VPESNTSIVVSHKQSDRELVPAQEPVHPEAALGNGGTTSPDIDPIGMNCGCTRKYAGPELPGDFKFLRS
jgi:hypothetical protein